MNPLLYSNIDFELTERTEGPVYMAQEPRSALNTINIINTAFNTPYDELVTKSLNNNTNRMDMKMIREIFEIKNIELTDPESKIIDEINNITNIIDKYHEIEKLEKSLKEYSELVTKENENYNTFINYIQQVDSNEGLINSLEEIHNNKLVEYNNKIIE
jgi:hypothetical protein